MSKQHLTPALLPLFLAGSALASGSDDVYTWTQWNGPAGDGVSREVAWSPTGQEENLWSAEVGLGYSTVVVADGRLFTMGYDKESGIDIVWCFDAVTGEELWTHDYPSEIWDRAHEGGTVNTPSLDGDVLYTLNREGNLYCLDAALGEVVWHNFLKPEENPHELEYPVWGFSASPLVLEDQLLLNCGRILSIDKKTGKVLWASEDYGHGYGTPIAFEHGGEPVLAVLNGDGVAVVSRKDGKERFFREFGGTNRGINSATPVLMGDNLFVSSGTLDAGALLGFGEGEFEEIWANKEMVNSFSGCVPVGGHLYGYDRAILKCIDLEGKEKWAVRGIGNGAVSAAGDKVIAMGGEGELIVCDATAEEYREHQRIKIFHDDARYWTKPILVNGIIYCRSSRGGLIARDHRVQR